MKKAKIASIILYSMVTVITLSMALTFLTANEYFSHHSEAAGIEWMAVPSGLQP